MCYRLCCCCSPQLFAKYYMKFTKMIVDEIEQQIYRDTFYPCIINLLLRLLLCCCRCCLPRTK
jgi:hypothetical protein